MRPLTYTDYLNLDTLLTLQEPRTPNSACPSLIQAEHFFIVTHQACELWLKQITTDLDAAAVAMIPPYGQGDAELALEFIERSVELLRVLHDQVFALEKLQLRHFAEFRPYLDGASGAQSSQFRMLAQLLGNERQQGRLYQAFQQLTRHHRLSVAEVFSQEPPTGVLNRIADGLLDVANGYWRWKMTHLALVSKMLGDREGTGGTTGTDYLARRVTLPLSELRRLRAHAHETPPPERHESVRN